MHTTGRRLDFLSNGRRTSGFLLTLKKPPTLDWRKRVATDVMAKRTSHCTTEGCNYLVFLRMVLTC